MYCPKCGVQLDDDSLFCKQCGEAVSDAAPSRITAEKLALILARCLIVYGALSFPFFLFFVINGSDYTGEAYFRAIFSAVVLVIGIVWYGIQKRRTPKK